MIHGPNVMMKYGAIVEGRRAELLAGKPKSEHEKAMEGFVEFLDMVRRGTPQEFEEWYQLYK